MKIKTEIEFDTQDVVDVFVTALEGGSNYWYQLNNTRKVKLFKDKTMTECIPLTVLNNQNVKIPVHDIDGELTDKPLGYISYKNIQRGISLYVKERGCFVPEMDAEEADCFLQYVVMGKLIFG